jgi:hypothetical protein
MGSAAAATADRPVASTTRNQCIASMWGTIPQCLACCSRPIADPPCPPHHARGQMIGLDRVDDHQPYHE